MRCAQGHAQSIGTFIFLELATNCSNVRSVFMVAGSSSGDGAPHLPQRDKMLPIEAVSKAGVESRVSTPLALSKCFTLAGSRGLLNHGEGGQQANRGAPGQKLRRRGRGEERRCIGHEEEERQAPKHGRMRGVVGTRKYNFDDTR